MKSPKIAEAIDGKYFAAPFLFRLRISDLIQLLIENELKLVQDFRLFL